MTPSTHTAQRGRQRGSAMIEFTVVGPVLTLIGTVILQYSLLFNAKTLLNHASFMAARAGSMGHADMAAVEAAYKKALVPLYGGGLSGAELTQAYDKAVDDLTKDHGTKEMLAPANFKIELLNPTKESFDDWNDADLQAKYGNRTIPNGGLAIKDAEEIKNNSGQNIQDANIIKLKITHGYELKVPLAGTMMQFMMRWGDTNKDAYATALYDRRRIPVVSYVTLQMQSDAWEPDNPVSSPGPGNNGTPTNPGFTETAKPAPKCVTATCGSGSATTSSNACPANNGTTTTLPADILFDFAKSTLTTAGKQ